MNEPITIECSIHVNREAHGRKELRPGGQAPPTPAPGRVPRITRLMALALRFDGLLRAGELANCAELARLGHVTRARVSQIMNLIHLAPDLQEAVLFLPMTERGRDAIILRQLQPIATTPDWRKQRRMWGELRMQPMR
jgi:hypothetical protein